MPDAVEIAQQRKARIAAEIAKLDNFIGMAEALVRQSDADARPGLATPERKSSPAARPDSA